jgi:hypothetical protein
MSTKQKTASKSATKPKAMASKSDRRRRLAETKRVKSRPGHWTMMSWHTSGVNSRIIRPCTSGGGCGPPGRATRMTRPITVTWPDHAPESQGRCIECPCVPLRGDLRRAKK